MPLWGSTSGDEAKPKYLDTARAENCYASNKGWEVTGAINLGNDNPAASEVLVAIGELADALANATITSVLFTSLSANVTATDTITVAVNFNEIVLANTSGGTPTLTLTNGAESGDANSVNVVLDYVSGNNTNVLVFEAALADTDPGATNSVAPTDVLTIGANGITLNSGTITDAEGGVASTLTYAEAGTVEVTG